MSTTSFNSDQEMSDHPQALPRRKRRSLKEPNSDHQNRLNFDDVESSNRQSSSPCDVINSPTKLSPVINPSFNRQSSEEEQLDGNNLLQPTKPFRRDNVHTFEFSTNPDNVGIMLGIGHLEPGTFSGQVKSRGETYCRKENGMFFRVDGLEGPPKIAGMNVGDELLVINGFKLEVVNSLIAVHMLLEEAARSGRVKISVVRIRRSSSLGCLTDLAVPPPILEQDLDEPPTMADSVESPSCEVNSPSYGAINIQLVKEAGGKNLGLGIVGGVDAPRGPIGFYIKTIYPNGLAAEDGRLGVGDELIAVNGELLEGLRHRDAVELFKKLEPGLILLTVIPGAPALSFSSQESNERQRSVESQRSSFTDDVTVSPSDQGKSPAQSYKDNGSAIENCAKEVAGGANNCSSSGKQLERSEEIYEKTTDTTQKQQLFNPSQCNQAVNNTHKSLSEEEAGTSTALNSYSSFTDQAGYVNKNILSEQYIETGPTKDTSALEMSLKLLPDEYSEAETFSESDLPLSVEIPEGFEDENPDCEQGKDQPCNESTVLLNDCSYADVSDLQNAHAKAAPRFEDDHDSDNDNQGSSFLPALPSCPPPPLPSELPPLPQSTIPGIPLPQGAIYGFSDDENDQEESIMIFPSANEKPTSFSNIHEEISSVSKTPCTNLLQADEQSTNKISADEIVIDHTKVSKSFQDESMQIEYKQPDINFNTKSEMHQQDKKSALVKCENNVQCDVPETVQKSLLSTKRDVTDEVQVQVQDAPNSEPVNTASEFSSYVSLIQRSAYKPFPKTPKPTSIIKSISVSEDKKQPLVENDQIVGDLNKGREPFQSELEAKKAQSVISPKAVNDTAENYNNSQLSRGIKDLDNSALDQEWNQATRVVDLSYSPVQDDKISSHVYDDDMDNHTSCTPPPLPLFSVPEFPNLTQRSMSPVSTLFSKTFPASSPSSVVDQSLQVLSKLPNNSNVRINLSSSSEFDANIIDSTLGSSYSRELTPAPDNVHSVSKANESNSIFHQDAVSPSSSSAIITSALANDAFSKSMRNLSKDEMISNVMKDYYAMEDPAPPAPVEEKKKPQKPLIAQALLPKSRRGSSQSVSADIAQPRSFPISLPTTTMAAIDIQSKDSTKSDTVMKPVEREAVTFDTKVERLRSISCEESFQVPKVQSNISASENQSYVMTKFLEDQSNFSNLSSKSSVCSDHLEAEGEAEKVEYGVHVAGSAAFFESLKNESKQQQKSRKINLTELEDENSSVKLEEIESKPSIKLTATNEKALPQTLQQHVQAIIGSEHSTMPDYSESYTTSHSCAENDYKTEKPLLDLSPANTKSQNISEDKNSSYEKSQSEEILYNRLAKVSEAKALFESMKRDQVKQSQIKKVSDSDVSSESSTQPLKQVESQKSILVDNNVDKQLSSYPTCDRESKDSGLDSALKTESEIHKSGSSKQCETAPPFRRKQTVDVAALKTSSVRTVVEQSAILYPNRFDVRGFSESEIESIKDQIALKPKELSDNSTNVKSSPNTIQQHEVKNDVVSSKIPDQQSRHSNSDKERIDFVNSTSAEQPYKPSVNSTAETSEEVRLAKVNDSKAFFESMKTSRKESVPASRPAPMREVKSDSTAPMENASETKNSNDSGNISARPQAIVQPVQRSGSLVAGFQGKANKPLPPTPVGKSMSFSASTKPNRASLDARSPSIPTPEVFDEKEEQEEKCTVEDILSKFDKRNPSKSNTAISDSRKIDETSSVQPSAKGRLFSIPTLPSPLLPSPLLKKEPSTKGRRP